MKKFWMVLCVLLGVLLVAGCSSGSGNQGTAGDHAGGTSTVKTATAHTYDVMKLDADATTVKALMPKVVKDEIAWKIKNGEVAGKDYVDVTGVEPVFVGYEIVAWTAATESQVKYVEIPYLNGHIAVSLGSPETELITAPDVGTFDKANVRSTPATPSEGELAAVNAAKQKIGQLLPGHSWNYGLKRYLFLYKVGETGMVMGTTLDGELGVYSSVVKIAK